MLGPWTVTAKRKREDADGLKPDYIDTRQSILNMSMCKLNTSPSKRVEPCLRRSVLIFNTLKHIEDELHSEGVKFNSKVEPSFTFTNVTSEMFESLPTSLESLAANIEQHIQSSANNISVVNSYISPENAREEVHLQQLTKMEIDDTNLSHTRVSSVLEHCRQASSLSFHGSPLRVEEFLTSLDASMLNMDLCTAMTPPTTNSKLIPLTVDDIVHSFSSNHTKVLQEPTFTQLVNASPQCKTVPDDRIGDELDSIMQILVSM